MKNKPSKRCVKLLKSVDKLKKDELIYLVDIIIDDYLGMDNYIYESSIENRMREMIVEDMENNLGDQEEDAMEYFYSSRGL